MTPEEFKAALAHLRAVADDLLVAAEESRQNRLAIAIVGAQVASVAEDVRRLVVAFELHAKDEAAHQWMRAAGG